MDDLEIEESEDQLDGLKALFSRPHLHSTIDFHGEGCRAPLKLGDD